MLDTPVTRALDQQNIPYRTFEHTGRVHSVEQAAAERNMQVDQVIRSIVFRLEEGEFVMVLAPGTHQISWPALRKYLDRSRLTMATEEEVLENTGYQLGAVSPFGLPRPMRILVDESVLASDEISLGSGKRSSAVMMKTEDFRKALAPLEIVRLVQPG